MPDLVKRWPQCLLDLIIIPAVSLAFNFWLLPWVSIGSYKTWGITKTSAVTPGGWPGCIQKDAGCCVIFSVLRATTVNGNSRRCSERKWRLWAKLTEIKWWTIMFSVGKGWRKIKKENLKKTPSPNQASRKYKIKKDGTFLSSESKAWIINLVFLCHYTPSTELVGSSEASFPVTSVSG